MSLLCRIGLHRLRWFMQDDQSWKPQCSRCRGVAQWYADEQEAQR